MVPNRAKHHILYLIVSDFKRSGSLLKKLYIDISNYIYPLREKYPYSEFFGPVFSHTRIEYGEILRISSYSVRMRENTDQINSEYGHFSRSYLFQRRT